MRPLLNSPSRRVTPSWLACSAIFCALLVFGLIVAGAQVTSNDAGLAVPDWPLAYGQAFPDRWMEVRNVFIEHFHRIYAFAVGWTAVALALACQFFEPRPYVRKFSLLLPVMVLAQGLIGAARIIAFSRLWIAMLHGIFGQLTFAAFVTLAIFMTAAWRRADGEQPAETGEPQHAGQFLPLALGIFLLLQLTLGAVMRHERWGLAIPGLPLLHGALPDLSVPGAAVALLHRLLGLTVALLLILQAVVLRGGESRVRRIAFTLIALALAQIFLGAATVLTGRNPWLASAHTAGGALLLVGQISLLLWLQRGAFAESAPAMAVAA